MHSGPLIQLSVLHIILQRAFRVHTVYVDEARIVIERVAVDQIRRLLRRKYKDCASLGVSIIRLRMASHSN